MKLCFHMLALLCALILVEGCSESPSRSLMSFHVTVRVAPELHKDSATLLALDEAYDRFIACGTSRAVNGVFAFDGQTDCARMAMIRFDHDSIPFYFVLEGGVTRLDIAPDKWSVGGDALLTKHYAAFVARMAAIDSERKSLWKEYSSLAADTALHRADELRLASRDSVLCDSVQRMIVHRIDRGDAVAAIIEHRFAWMLDSVHAAR